MRSEHAAITPGTLLGGRYRVERLLGQGGMGAVYEATQEGLRRRVAVKLLDSTLATDPAQIERFRREGEVVAALGHPNIVQVTDFDSCEHGPFLVMELLRGQSLGALLDAERTVAPNRIAFIAAQVLSALGAAHRAGIVHRDIKPDNVFLLAEAAVPDTVKVLDFGIAKLVADGQSAKLTGTGAMLGTPSFMAPEQARGAVDVDARADIYAVGATMYQALTGRLPLEAASVPALLFAIVEQQPTPLRDLRPDLPADFIAVIERAMAKDRGARFASADEMRSALAPWSGLPVSSAQGISTTAPTLAGVSAVPVTAPPAQPTPVVHHHPTLPSEGHKRGMSPLAIVMLSLVAIVTVVMVGLVMLVRANAQRHEGKPEARPEDKRVEEQGVAIASTSAPTSVSAPTSTPTRPAAPVTVPIASATASAITITSATATASTSTGGAAGGRHYGGATGYLSSVDFSACPSCDWASYRAEVTRHEPEISACFKAAELEPPVHENPMYQVGVTSVGALHTFKAMGDGTPKLDRCIRDILFRITLHKPTGGDGSFNISFRAECVKGWPGQCK